MVWTGVVFLLIHHVIGRPNISATAVCGTDGRTYKDEEELRIAQSDEVDLRMLHPGSCLTDVQESLLQKLKPTYRIDGNIHGYHLRVSLPGIYMEYVGPRPEISEKPITHYEDIPRISQLRGGVRRIWIYNPALHLPYLPIIQPPYQPVQPYYTQIHQLSNQPPYLPSYQQSYKPPQQLSYQPFYKPSYQQSHQLIYQPSYQPPYETSYESTYHPKFSPIFMPNYPSDSQFQYSYHTYFPNNVQNSHMKYPPASDLVKYDWKNNGNSGIEMENTGQSKETNIEYITKNTFEKKPENYQGNNVENSLEVISNSSGPSVTHLITNHDAQNMQLPNQFGGDQNSSINLETIGEAYNLLYPFPKATPLDFNNTLENIDASQKSVIDVSYPGYIPTPSLDENSYSQADLHVPHNNDLKDNLPSESSPATLNDNFITEFIPSQTKDNAPTELINSGLKDHFASESVHSGLDNNEGDSTYAKTTDFGDVPSDLKDNSVESRESLPFQPINNVQVQENNTADIIDPNLKFQTEGSNDPYLDHHPDEELRNLEDNMDGNKDSSLNIPLPAVLSDLVNNTGVTKESYLNPYLDEEHLSLEDMGSNEDSSLNTSPKQEQSLDKTIGESSDPYLNPPLQEVPSELEDNNTKDSYLNTYPDKEHYSSENKEGRSEDFPLNSPPNNLLEENTGGSTDILNPRSREKLFGLVDITGDQELPPEDELSGLDDNMEGNEDISLNPSLKKTIVKYTIGYKDPSQISNIVEELPNLEDKMEGKEDSPSHISQEKGHSWIDNTEEKDPYQNPSSDELISSSEDNTGRDTSLNPPPEVVQTFKNNTGSSTDSHAHPSTRDKLSVIDDNTEESIDLPLNRSPEDIHPGSDVDMEGNIDPSLNLSSEPTRLEDDVRQNVNTSLHPPFTNAPSNFGNNTLPFTYSSKDYPSGILNLSVHPHPSGFKYKPLGSMGEGFEHQAGINEESKQYNHPYLDSEYIYDYFIPVSVESDSLLRPDSIELGYEDSVEENIKGHTYKPGHSVGFPGKNGVSAGRNWLGVHDSNNAVDSYDTYGEGLIIPQTHQDADGAVSASLHDDLPSHDYQHIGTVSYDEPCDIQNWFRK